MGTAVKFASNILTFAILFLVLEPSGCEELPSEVCGYDSTGQLIGGSKLIRSQNDRRMSYGELYKKATDLEIIIQRIGVMAESFCKGAAGDADRLPENWLADGSFKSINYASDASAAKKHARKLCGVLYDELFDKNSAGVSTEKIKKSFAYITQFKPTVIQSNWWDHLIGNPGSMWQAAFFARDNITSDEMEEYLDKYFKNTPVGPVWDTACRSGRNTGVNFGPRALIAFPEAILRNRFDAFHEELKYRLIEELVERRGFNDQGLRFDGSIHQHNTIVPNYRQKGVGEGILLLHQNYMANYGKELLMNVAKVLYIMNGASYEFEENIRNATFDCFFEGEKWIYRGHTIDPSSTGRFIDQGSVVTDVGSKGGVLETLTYLDKVPFRNEEVKSALHRYQTIRPDLAHALIGNKNFFSSDGMAHQRRDYMATLKMISRRCPRQESYKTKNIYGYFLGDGFLTLVVDGDELGSPNAEVFQTYNWARIPGVTCPYMDKDDIPVFVTNGGNLLHMINDHHFVGGVSDGKFGLAAMVYARPTITVRARKSFFFLDKVIFAMGSGITQTNSTDNSNIATTINQVMYSGVYSGGVVGNIESSTVKGQRVWSQDLRTDLKSVVHHQTVGYVSLGSDGKLITEVAEETKDVFSVWIDHGPLVTDAKYAYAMLPYQTVAETEAFAIEPTVSVLSQTNSKHDVCDLSTKIEGVVLFDAGCFQISNCLDLPTAEVCSDQSSLILAKIIPLADKGTCAGEKNVQNNALVGSVIRLDVSDPTHLLNTLNLELKMNGIAYAMEVDLPDDPMLGDTTNVCFVFTI